MTIQNFENNRAFTHGEAVKVYFFRRNGELILAEDTYFHLMSSMRRMRMEIPMNYTLEYFTFMLNSLGNTAQNGIHQLMVFPIMENGKKVITHHEHFLAIKDICDIQKTVVLDIQKEITVNTHFLSNIRTYSPENCYAQVYAVENDLDDVILLNPNKKIARTIHGNLLLLKGEELRVVKPSEGAYLSPLMESFITHLHKKKLATITEAEIAPFETQQAEEILLISDELGIMSVNKIRAKSFENNRFTDLLEDWKQSFGNDKV